MEKGKVTFIRRNGRVIPIRAKGNQANGKKPVQKVETRKPRKGELGRRFFQDPEFINSLSIRDVSVGERFRRGGVTGAKIGGVFGAAMGALAGKGRSISTTVTGAAMGAASFGLNLGLLNAALGRRKKLHSTLPQFKNR